ncbi:MAG TPA: GNAT family N-acetyltransferase [Burkholderiales bacterium]|nr:GNAT family N-acetyltransferase [Burkholderiales bacterium]
MSFAVRFVDSEAQIDAHLWDACFPPTLEGRWWYATLERAGLEDQFSFRYGVIQRDGVDVGIAPAFVMDFPVSLVAPPALLGTVQRLGKIFPRLVKPRTLFVGSPCAEEGTVGMLPGVDAASALRALQQALVAQAREVGAPLLVWKDCPAGLEWLASEAGLFPVVSFPGTIAELHGAKEAYYAALKGSRRHQFRKKLRRSAAALNVRVEVIQRPDERTLDAVFALFWQTYEKAATKFERLNRGFFARIAEQPRSHFVLLRERATDELIAFMLCFDLGAKVINKFIGIDYTRPREWQLYFRLWDAAVDWALARGASAIQSGQTGYAPKIETGHRLVPLTNYCAHRNGVIHAVARLAARRIDWSSLDDDLARYIRAHPEEL